MLSALSVETICSVAQIAKTLGVHVHPLQPRFDQLDTQGLVKTFKMGKQHYVSITSDGLSHPQYEPDAPKAPAADLCREFGEKRARLLRALSALKQASAADLANALSQKSPEDVIYIVRRLVASGLIDRSSGDKNPRIYRLSFQGTSAVRLLDRSRPPLPSSHDSDAGRRRKQQILMREHGIEVRAALIEELRRHGPSTQVELLEAIHCNFQHRRSLDRALNQLEKRGIVRRCRNSDGSVRKSGTGFHYWELFGGADEMTKARPRSRSHGRQRSPLRSHAETTRAPSSI